MLSIGVYQGSEWNLPAFFSNAFPFLVKSQHGSSLDDQSGSKEKCSAGRWPWAGAGYVHGTPWEPRLNRDPDQRGLRNSVDHLAVTPWEMQPHGPIIGTMLPRISDSFPIGPPVTSLAAISLVFLETQSVNDGFLMTSFQNAKCIQANRYREVHAGMEDKYLIP